MGTIVFQTLLFSLLVFNLTSQTVFLPNIGTKWHYSFSYFFTGSKMNTKIEYIKDSIDIANNDTIKVLSTGYKFFSYCNIGAGNYTYIKQKHDSVWFYNNVSNNSWQLLFVYSAITGDSWTYQAISAGQTLNTYTVTVNSVSAVTINTTSLKVLNVSNQVGAATYTSAIYERIGGIGFLFNTALSSPSSGSCDFDFLDKFLCYEDSTLGLKQFTSYPCNYSTGIDRFSINGKNLTIYPIPASDELYIGSENDFYEEEFKIEIVDNLGQLIRSQEIVLKNGKSSIDVKLFATGVYLLNIKTANSERMSKRFIITR